MHILVVDDEDEIRELFAALLERKGFTVTQACDGLDALSKLSKHDITLILCDVMMPKMSGIDFVQEIRTKLKSDIPFIFMTGHSGTELKELIEFGANAVFEKPVPRKDLLGKIKELLNIK